MQKMKVGLIGYGERGEHYSQRFDEEAYGADLSEYTEELHIAEPLEKRRSEISKYSFEVPVKVYETTEEMYEKSNLDLVIEASNEPRRTKTLQPFIEDGVHVLSEKPLSRELYSAGKLTQLAKDNGIIAAVGENMNQHPGFIDARDYLLNDSVKIDSINIDWFKNRGPRDHPLPEGIVDDIPHLTGFVTQLVDKPPSSIEVTNYGTTAAVVDPEKYENLSDKDREKIELMEGPDDYQGDLLWYQIPSKVDISLEWKDGMTASLRASYDTARMERTLLVSGDADDKKLNDNYFENKVSVKIDFAATGEEKSYEVTKGLKDGETRAGRGETIEEKTGETYGDFDTLDSQLEKFFRSVQEGKLDRDLTSFEEALRGEEIINEAKSQIEGI